MHVTVRLLRLLGVLVFVFTVHADIWSAVDSNEACFDGKLLLDLQGEYIIVEYGVLTNCSEGRKPICCQCVGPEKINNFENDVLLESCSVICDPANAIPDNAVADPSRFSCTPAFAEGTLTEEARSIAIIIVCSVLIALGIFVAVKFGRARPYRQRQWDEERERIVQVSGLWTNGICCVGIDVLLVVRYGCLTPVPLN